MLGAGGAESAAGARWRRGVARGKNISANNQSVKASINEPSILQRELRHETLSNDGRERRNIENRRIKRFRGILAINMACGRLE